MTRKQSGTTGAIKILSGGQTGVDRGALDAALEAGVACGGWCPRGRLAEDGTIPAHYPLEETDSPRYSMRTRQNVLDSDVTVIIFFEQPKGGTALTLQYCRQLAKPQLLIDASNTAPERAAEQIARFCADTAARRLNLAGPRASDETRAYDYTRQTLSTLLSELSDGNHGS